MPRTGLATLVALSGFVALGAACTAERAHEDELRAAPLVAAEPTAIALEDAASFTATIPVSGDAVDVHHPPADAFAPVVVLLQGANVDKAEYASFAREVARYGFIVLVPNHARSLGGPSGLFTSEEVVTQALDFAVAEGKRAGSPLVGRVDGSRLGLLGHSFGGVVGLFSIQGTCAPPFCTPGAYTRPTALRAGAFWGTNLKQGSALVPIDTSAASVALLQGSLDGKSPPAAGLETYDELAAPKAFITVRGANHYGINEHDNPSSATPDPTAPVIPQAESVMKAATMSGLFLRAHVRGDIGAAAIVARASSLGGIDVRSE